MGRQLSGQANWHAQIKHLCARPAAFRRLQFSMLVASQVVLLLLPPANHVALFTLQSRLISPHGCAGSNQEAEEG